jgi:hypothetical protein
VMMDCDEASLRPVLDTDPLATELIGLGMLSV